MTGITNEDVGKAADLMADYVDYCTDKSRIWSANAREIYEWWLKRSTAKVTASYATTNDYSVLTIGISGSQHTNTSIEILVPGVGSAFVAQALANGITTTNYRISGELVKILVGTTVTNVQLEYTQLPVAKSDYYFANQTQTLSVALSSGVISNDFSGTWPGGLLAVTNSAPAHGSLTAWNNNGSFTYQPATNGAECFTYRLTDGTGDFGTGTVTLLISQAGSLYSDLFSRCSPETLYPWQTYSASVWSMSGNVMQGSRSGDYGYAYMSAPWSNSNFSVEAQVQFGSGSFGGGLGARVAATPSGGAHYAAWLYPSANPSANFLRLIKFYSWNQWGNNGSDNHAALAEITVPSIGTTWHPLKLVCSNNVLQILYHGTNAITFTDSTSPHSSGGASLDVYNGTISASNLVVRPTP